MWNKVIKVITFLRISFDLVMLIVLTQHFSSVVMKRKQNFEIYIIFTLY